MALALRHEPLWRRLLNLISTTADPYGRPETGRPAPGLATGAEQYYSDGFRPGDVKYSYGVLAQLLARNPGWALADGTVVLEDGTTPPDLRDRVIIGAGTTYALGDTGGSAAGHTHSFTHESAHGITDPDPTVSQQPSFAGPTGHAITQPVVAAHGSTPTEVLATPGTGLWVPAYGTAAATTAALAHSLNTNVALSENNPHTAPAIVNNVTLAESDMTLTNNSPHAGGAVGAASAGVLTPYAALYPLIKVH